ncbi:MAG: hypothetical protein KA436_11560 [Oligoflexales bacterium]|nr:hypothetical protein [Oligoflexales bacterium]
MSLFHVLTLHQRSCLLCYGFFKVREQSLHVCEVCLAQFWIPDCTYSYFHSLYTYSSELRKLILMAKIQGSYQAVDTLVHLFTHSELALRLARQAECISPAPSSAWSRLRGRLDLGFLLAEGLAQKTDRTLVELPFMSYWKWKKRARDLHKEKISWDFLDARKGLATQLLVDDIITTGHTYRRMVDYLPPSEPVQLLTLADAFTKFNPFSKDAAAPISLLRGAVGACKTRSAINN